MYPLAHFGADSLWQLAMDSNNPNRKVNEYKCILLNKVSYVTESVKGRRNLTPGEFGYENIENH